MSTFVAEEARVTLQECERIRPGFVNKRAEWRPYPDLARNEKLFAGLKQVGLAQRADGQSFGR